MKSLQHNRRIFHYSERFPCFDSADYLHERRRSHWIYLRLGRRLICLSYADQTAGLKIDPKVSYIPQSHRDAMEKAGFPAE